MKFSLYLVMAVLLAVMTMAEAGRIRKARINVLPAQVTPTPTKKSFLQSWATSAPFARSGASTSKTGAQGLVKPAVVQPSPKPVSGAAAVPNFGSNSAFMNTLGRRISAQSNTTPAQTMLILQLIYDAFREAFPGVPLPAIPFTSFHPAPTSTFTVTTISTTTATATETTTTTATGTSIPTP